jgi:hypothetical protein
MSIKLKVARAQLGTALSLFIRDKDPYAVQALACGGCEVAEGLATIHGIEPLSTHLLATHPAMDMRALKSEQNIYWNAIKHFWGIGKFAGTARDDEDLMSTFSDEQNDARLFIGWWDYMLVTGRLPIEAQVLQVWWYALNEERLAPHVDVEPIRSIFPRIVAADRLERKRRLRRAVEKYRKNEEVLADPKTEAEPLLLSL